MFDIVNATAQKTGRDLFIFDDSKLPSFNETMLRFHQADVIIAPHGAGLTNMMFARPGTTIFEVTCNGNFVGTCYRTLAAKLGLRYVAMETISVNKKRKCAGGLIADIGEFRRILDAVVKYIIFGQ